MRYEIIKKSIIGKRNEQQDCIDYFQHEDLICAIVCDGMGGMECGAQASHTAVYGFKELLNQTEKSIQDIPAFFLQSVDVLDESVCSIMDASGNRANTGSTIVSVLIREDKLYWLSVGDSRLYILRGNEMLQVTRDHNYLFTLNQMLEQNAISKEQYAQELPKGETLTSYLGMGGIEFMDICHAPFIVASGDQLLLTTDGLYKTLSNEEIMEVWVQPACLKESAEKLIEKVEEKGLPNQDNTSFIIMKITEEE